MTFNRFLGMFARGRPRIDEVQIRRHGLHGDKIVAVANQMRELMDQRYSAGMGVNIEPRGQMRSVFIQSRVEKQLSEMNDFSFVLFENECHGIAAARSVQTSKKAFGVEQIVFRVRQFSANRNNHLLEFPQQRRRYYRHLEELL